MKENIDYHLTPGEEDIWNIRLLTGDYVETVFSFGALKVSEDGESLNFNYEIVSTPNEELQQDNPDFAKTVENVLISILETITENEANK